MINKYYEKFKKFIKDNYLFLTFYITLIAVLFYPLPYYIYNGGGTINVDKRIEIENSYKDKGSFNLCYVSEIKATISSYILAKILPEWDIIKSEEVVLNNNETDKDVFIRNRIYLNNANINAISVAYKKASKEFNIKKTDNYVIYLTEKANTNIKIGDKITSVDGQTIETLEELRKLVNTKNINDKIIFKVERNGKEKDCYATVYEEKNNKLVGISIQNNYDYTTNPDIKLKFTANESGPSGGLLLSLSIYNHLVKEDITNGLKIAGTGTIDENGSVGEIGGVKYKLKGAISDNADIFIVPNGENYKEAISLQKKHNYDIKIIGVSTFDEALEKLQEMSK